MWCEVKSSVVVRMYVYIFSVATQRCLELVYVRVPTPGLEWEHSCVAAVFVHFVVVVVVAFFFFFSVSMC